MRFEVLEAAEGIEALEQVARHSFDVIVIDDMLRDVDALAACRAIRSRSRNPTVPIMLLVAHGAVADIALGLESGADHCMPRTLGAREAEARLLALVRRTIPSLEPIGGRRRLCTHDVTVDPERRSASIHGHEIDLTMREFELLYILASRPGIVFSRAVLLTRLQHRDRDVTERTIDTVISRLRAKIEHANAPSLIRTVWGIGYKFTAE
jgi:DNA-binding response OmpR family regulator